MRGGRRRRDGTSRLVFIWRVQLWSVARFSLCAKDCRRRVVPFRCESTMAEALLWVGRQQDGKWVPMSQLFAKALLYAHVVSLPLSVGGLFGYLLIVWLMHA
jgi:hypothetical protein